MIGAIVGVGAARRASAVRWNSIAIAWIVTIAGAAMIGALPYVVAGLF